MGAPYDVVSNVGTSGSGHGPTTDFISLTPDVWRKPRPPRDIGWSPMQSPLGGAGSRHCQALIIIDLLTATFRQLFDLLANYEHTLAKRKGRWKYFQRS